MDLKEFTAKAHAWAVNSYIWGFYDLKPFQNTNKA